MRDLNTPQSVAAPEISPTERVAEALRISRDALDSLSSNLAPMEPALDAAVDAIFGMTGRLIVSGLGKSGHIGSKLAATFSSTGTPAYFVHPAEASHGDLGMIRSDDVVLMLSWSGETKELCDLTAYCRRFRVPLILMTSNGSSSIARSADITLELPKVREACPHNLAPTSSTLLQLALGDAIAVALLSRRGFSETSFHEFHPGGKLGASLTRISEIMASGDAMPLVSLDSPVIDVIGELSAKSLGIVGVVGADDTLAGVVTDGDIRRYLESQSDKSMATAMRKTFARDIMTAEPVTLAPERLAARALSVMETRRISAAFVTEGNKPVGVITMLRLLNAGVA